MRRPALPEWLKRSKEGVDQTSMPDSARPAGGTSVVAAVPNPELAAAEPKVTGSGAAQDVRVGPARVGVRIATAGLVLVLLLLTGFVTWTSARITQATNEVARTTHVSDAWDQALLSLGTQVTLLERYRVDPDPAVRARFAWR